MKRKNESIQKFSIQQKLKRETLLLEKPEASVVKPRFSLSQPFSSWFSPSTYCTPSKDPVQQNYCAQPNYPALWSYQYGISPLRSWLVNQIPEGGYLRNNNSDVSGYENILQTPYLDQNENCSQISLGEQVYEFSPLGAEYWQPYWIAGISFLLAFYFYNEDEKPNMPIIGTRFPAFYFALNSFAGTYLGNFFRDNLWDPFVTSWFDLFSVSWETQRAIESPILNSYFSFMFSELINNRKTASTATILTLVSTLIKERIIDNGFIRGPFDALFGNQSALSTPSGPDQYTIDCTVYSPNYNQCTRNNGQPACYYTRDGPFSDEDSCKSATATICEQIDGGWWPTCDQNYSTFCQFTKYCVCNYVTETCPKMICSK